MARRWLPSLRGERSDTTPPSAEPPPVLESKNLPARVQSSYGGGYSSPGQPYATTWNVDRAVREGFQQNPWVFRAVEVIAFAALDLPIVARMGHPITGTIMPPNADRSRLLYRLNKKTNPWETAKLWRYRLYAQFLLSSKGVFIEVNRNAGGGYAMFTLLDPDLVDPVPSLTDPIASFQVRTTVSRGGRVINTLPRFKAGSSDAASVLWVRSPHPTILHRGMSPVEAAGLSLDLDRYARLYNRQYMQSGGRPDGVLAIKGEADQHTMDALEAKFNGEDRAGRTTAIQADAISYADLAKHPRDMQWSETMDRMRKEASMVFGVPESMMGDASGRTFDNADAEYAIFWQNRLGPLLSLLDDQLDVLTPGGQSDESYLRHDTSGVWVLSRHQRAEHDRAAADLDRGVITIDDYRERIGLPRLDVPATRVLWLRPGNLAVADGADEHADDASDAAAAPMGGQPQPADPAAEAQAGAQLGAAEGAYAAATNNNAAQLRLAAADGQDRSSSGGGNDSFDPGELETAGLPVTGLEGKQRRARPRRAVTAPRSAAWR